MVGGSGADLITFRNVVGNTSVQGFGGSSTDTANDSVVFLASASGLGISLAEGNDSLRLSKGATNATIAAAGGNDSIYANLNLKGSSIEAGAGTDSISITAGTSTTIKGGSGATVLIMLSRYMVILTLISPSQQL